MIPADTMTGTGSSTPERLVWHSFQRGNFWSTECERYTLSYNFGRSHKEADLWALRFHPPDGQEAIIVAHVNSVAHGKRKARSHQKDVERLGARR